MPHEWLDATSYSKMDQILSMKKKSILENDFRNKAFWLHMKEDADPVMGPVSLSWNLLPFAPAYTARSCPLFSKAVTSVALITCPHFPQEGLLFSAQQPPVTCMHLYTLPSAGLSAHS